MLRGKRSRSSALLPSGGCQSTFGTGQFGARGSDGLRVKIIGQVWVRESLSFSLPPYSVCVCLSVCIPLSLSLSVSASPPLSLSLSLSLFFSLSRCVRSIFFTLLSLCSDRNARNESRRTAITRNKSNIRGLILRNG